MQHPDSYIDLLNDFIFSFKSCDGWAERYPTKNVKVVSPKLLTDLAAAGKAMYDIFNKTSLALRNADQELIEILRLPLSLQPYMSVYNPFELCSYMARLDFLLDQNGCFKLVEINSDTPCAVVESYYANKVACDYSGLRDPNAGMNSHISRMFAEIISAYKEQGYKTHGVCFASQHDYLEDFDTTRYLMNHSGLDGFYAPLQELRVKDDGLYAYGIKIDVLYRLHPMEMLVEDTDVDGYRTGLALLDLVKQKKLVMINPPSAILMQLKSLYAFIWSLKNTGAFFTKEEAAQIEKYMLSSSLHSDHFSHTDYIRKPIFGREGAGISIFNTDGDCVESTEEGTFAGPYMYQEFCSTPTEECITDNGHKNGSLTYSVFNFMGRSSAFFCRFEEGLIAGKDAFWLPMGMAA